MKKHLYGTLLLLCIVVISTITYARDTEYHWGFKRSTDNIPAEAGGELDALLAKYGAIYKGRPDQKIAYLTFDNGYENGFTESILTTLRDEEVPATFFLTGHYVKSAPELVRQMVKDGHLIGNHSYDHPNMARLSASEMKKEWQRFDDALRQLTDMERTYYARPPEGIFNEEVLRVGNEAGYRHMFWSIAFKDWLKDERRGADYAYNALMEQLHPGAVILMHTVAQDNAEAMPAFIRDAKKQGYTFASLDDLVLEYEGITP